MTLYILVLYIKIFFRKCRFVSQHLIGRNDRAVCKDMLCHGDAFNIAWRIVPHAQGWLAMATPSASLLSKHRIHIWAERERRHHTSWATESSEARGSDLLNCSLSYLLKEISTIASTLERSEECHWPARLYTSWTVRYSASCQARGEVTFLSCLFKLFGAIVSFERSETSPIFLAVSVHALACSEGCGLQVHL